MKFLELISKNKQICLMSLVLLFFSFTIHFFNLDKPDQVIFDEVHFGSFASNYVLGKSFFDIHPPLGKLIIALGAKVGGYSDYVDKNGPFDFSEINNQYKEMPIFWFRFFPALAGTLFPVVFFVFLISIDFSEKKSFFLSSLIILENGLLVQSRFILIDSFMFLFGFLGLLLFFIARKNKHNFKLLFLSSIFLAFSISIKWIALSYLAIVLLILFLDYLTFFIKSKIKNKKLFFIRSFFQKLFFMLFNIIVIYISFFYVHFSLFKENDSAFLASVLIEEEQSSSFAKTLELNKQMYTFNVGLNATHVYSSTPFEWLAFKKPIYYWVNYRDDFISQVVFLGNPILWFFGIFGVGLFPFFWKKIKLDNEIKIALYFGFWINFLPFILVQRVIFMYHYLNALIFSLIISFLFFSNIIKKDCRKTFFAILLLAAFLFFVVIYYSSVGRDFAIDGIVYKVTVFLTS